MGAYEDITWYFWNWYVWLVSIGQLRGCWYYGGWGLIFDDDAGKLMEECYGWYGGAKVEFPYEYSMWAQSTPPLTGVTNESGPHILEYNLGLWILFSRVSQHRHDDFISSEPWDLNHTKTILLINLIIDT